MHTCDVGWSLGVWTVVRVGGDRGGEGGRAARGGVCLRACCMCVGGEISNAYQYCCSLDTYHPLRRSVLLSPSTPASASAPPAPDRIAGEV